LQGIATGILAGGELATTENVGTLGTDQSGAAEISPTA
jgi:hypothetical protein